MGRERRGDMTFADDHTSEIEQLWHSSDASKWQHALDRYCKYIKPTHLELEREMDTLRPDDVRYLDADQWYDWLLKKYFVWKYTAPNRYATTTGHLKRQATDAGRHHLLTIRDRVLSCENASIGDALRCRDRVQGTWSGGRVGPVGPAIPG